MTEEQIKRCSDVYYQMEDLCAEANEPLEAEVIEKYLKSNRHGAFRVCEAFTERCRAELRRVKNGKPSPDFSFICCDECFKLILSETPSETYSVYSTTADEDDSLWLDVKPLASPMGLEREELVEFLEDNYCGLAAVSEYRDNKDCERRKKYVAALEELLRASVRLAKRLDASEAAMDLLLAYRYLLIFTKRKPSKLALVKPVMKVEEAAESYAALKRGFAKLWCASAYAEFEPL